MPMPSFKDVLMKGVKDSTDGSKKLARGISRMKGVKDSTNDSRKLARGISKVKGVKDSTNDSKKLARGIWSRKPIHLNISPGDIFFLDRIMLTEPSRAKKFQERVKDKYLCFLMLPMSPMSRGHAESTFCDAMMLRDVYEHIESSGGEFEVICVPTHSPYKDEQNQLKFNYDDNFDPYPHHLEIKLHTPFTHISINDNACLERIEKTIGLPNYPEPAYVIVGPEGDCQRRVVSIFDNDFLNWHGAEAYPFTIEKIQQLAREDVDLRSGKHDLGTLLSTPDRDFVISNDYTKVPISDLQQKTVCLLFYEDHWECRKRTEELKQVYKAHKDFEVVVVFAITFGHDTSHLVEEFGNFRLELKFWKVFCDMPWLAVPFDDPKCRQLWRIFNRTKMGNSYAPKLIIVYSEGKYFEENGFQVLEETKFKNYPFMGKELVQNAVGVRGKTLSSVLGQDVELLRNDEDYDSDWQYGQEKYTISELFGAPVALLFIGVSGFSEFLLELDDYHSVACLGMSKFEVVYVPMTESSPDPYSFMLVSPSAKSNQEHLIPLFAHLFEDEITQNPEKKFTLALVTFGPFGHYSGQGIIYTNSSEDAYQLFLEIFPFRNNATKEYFKSRHSANNRGEGT